MTAPSNDVDMDLSLFLAGPLGAAVCAKKVYGWFHEGKGPAQTTDVNHESWSKVSSIQAEVSDLINKAVRDSGASWGGAAGDQMRSSTSPLGSWADAAGTRATAGSNTMAEVSDAFRTAQNSVQKPVDVPDKPWYNDAIPWDTDYDDAVEKSQGVDQANMQALSAYGDRANASMSSMPQFESPNSSTANVDDKPPAQVDQTKQYDGYNDKTGTSSVSSTSTPPGSTPGTTTTPSWTAPPTTGQNPNLPNIPTPSGNPNQPGTPLPGVPLPGGPFPGGNQKPGPGNTKPGMPGSRPGVPGGGAGRGGGPGAAGAARGPGGLGGLGGAPKGGSFGPLGSGGSSGVLGAQGRAGGFGPSGSGAAGGRGAVGAAGGMAGGAGAGRGQGAEDQEHTTKYVEKNDEAFGDDRMVAPPVIGE